MKNPLLNLLLSLLVVIFIASSASSQTPRLWLGVHGGVDIGSFSYDPELSDPDPSIKITNGSRTGIAAGAEVNYWFSNNLGICGQLSYVQKGYKQDYAFTFLGQEFTGSSEGTFSYLQIPVLFKARFGDGSVKPFLIIGPEVGIKLSASQTVTSGGRDSTMDVPDSVVSAANFGLLFGAGVSYDLNPTTQIYLSAGYNYGLSNLNAGYGDDRGNGTKDNQRIFSRDIRISLGVMFGLGGRGSGD